MTTRSRFARSAAIVMFAGWLMVAGRPCALDYVTIRQGQSQREVAGKIEVEAVDGGVMLLARDGALWPVQKENLISRRSDAKPFAPLTRDELVRQLAGELTGFKAH